MNLLQRLTRGGDEQRYTLDDYAQQLAVFGYAGQDYQGVQQTYSPDRNRTTETAGGGFEQRVRGAYQANGVVFACQLSRLMLFTEVRFQFQQIRNGRPGDLFGTPALALLEQPWVNGSTGELLARMIQDVDLSGNAYVRRTGPTATPMLERLRPDWMFIVLGSNSDLLTSEIVGYAYQPGGPGSTADPIFLDRSEVAHWAPIPDPLATYRGMSWLAPIVREIRGDQGMVDHKQKFLDHAATPNMVVKFDPTITPEKAQAFKAMLETEHAGAYNAYKTMYLGGGADATVVGQSMQQMDFKAVQGAGETRIAAAAGVPPIIVGLSEGLASATYSNYAQARRRFADMTIRPLWRSACAALANLVETPNRTRLWYDDRDVSALQEDEKDAADILSVDAQTVASLVREGFTPESAVAAVTAQDLTLLSHTGRLSVQLKDANGDGQPDSPTPALDGANANGA